MAKLTQVAQAMLTLPAKDASFGFPSPSRFPTRVEAEMLKAVGNMKQNVLMD
jgi:hypothetical protein